MLCHVAGDAIANNIMMMSSSMDKCFLILEGSTDRLLFDKFINQRESQLVPANDKEKAVAAIRELNNRRFDKGCAVVDADFERALGIPSVDDNLFRTDYHDCEIVMIASKALTDLVAEWGDSAKIKAIEDLKGKSFREILLDLSLPIGCLRLASVRNSMKLSFKRKDPVTKKRFPIEFDFVNPLAASIDVDLLAERVAENNRNKGFSKNDLVQCVSDEMALTPDVYQVCHGHDTCRILGMLLSEHGILSGREADGNRIEKLLRCCYQWVYFTTTELRKDLKEWERHRRKTAFAY